MKRLLIVSLLASSVAAAQPVPIVPAARNIETLPPVALIAEGERAVAEARRWPILTAESDAVRLDLKSLRDHEKRGLYRQTDVDRLRESIRVLRFDLRKVRENGHL